MDDLISRSALLEAIQTDVEDGGVSGMVAGALKRYVKRAPAVDAVIPVRCAQCKHGRKMIGNSYHYCVPHNTKMYADDFCSYGERKEGADNG